MTSKIAIFKAAQRERKEKMDGRFIRSLWIDFYCLMQREYKEKKPLRAERTKSEQRANREKKEKRRYFYISSYLDKN